MEEVVTAAQFFPVFCPGIFFVICEFISVRIFEDLRKVCFPVAFSFEGVGFRDGGSSDGKVVGSGHRCIRIRDGCVCGGIWIGRICIGI